jgi:hypothetical protein
MPYQLTTELQAKLLKWAAGLLIFGGILFTVYLQGRDDGKAACQNAVQRQVAKLADQRADNAVEATTRFGDFVRNDRALEIGIADALSQVHDFYANQKPKTQTVKVQLPGKKEYVYVPTDSCSPNVLDADELRLYNLGNKRSDLNNSDSKSVSGAVPSGPP